MQKIIFTPVRSDAVAVVQGHAAARKFHTFAIIPKV